jgi:hypothetical protein
MGWRILRLKPCPDYSEIWAEAMEAKLAELIGDESVGVTEEGAGR